MMVFMPPGIWSKQKKGKQQPSGNEINIVVVIVLFCLDMKSVPFISHQDVLSRLPSLSPPGSVQKG